MSTEEAPYEPIPDHEGQESDRPLIGGEDTMMKPEGRSGDALGRLAALVSVGAITVVTWVLVLTNDPSSLGWFAPHPLLQTFALTMFTLGIMTLQPTSQPKTKAAGLARHQLIMLLGFAAIIMGTAFMIYNKYDHDAAHFTSWHGTLGIICVAWLVVQVFVGAASVWFDGSFFGGGAKAKAVWKYHRASGYVLFPAMLFTVYIAGAYSTWVTSHSSAWLRFPVYTVAPAILLIAVWARVRTSKMNFS